MSLTEASDIADLGGSSKYSGGRSGAVRLDQGSMSTVIGHG